MADYDCDFCAYESTCPYEYQCTDCRIESIKAARAVVDNDFKVLLAKVEHKNEHFADGTIGALVWKMREIIAESELELPPWAIK